MECRPSLKCASLLAVLLVPLLLGVAGCEPTVASGGVMGHYGGIGLADGDFVYPRAIAIDRLGRQFIVDKSARIQRFSPDGEFELSWDMPEKQSGKPVGLTITDDDRLFVADTHYHRIMIFDLDGNELARFGSEGMGEGQFIFPTDVALDAEGNIFVGEYGGNDRITKFSPKFEFIKCFADTEIEGYRVSRPTALDFDESGRLWVSDACNHRVLSFDNQGQFLAAWGTCGEEPGKMRYPYDLECLPDGKIMVCEFGNNRVQWFDDKGTSLETWGSHGRELGCLWAPWGAAMGTNGRLYVVDSLNARVQIVKR